MSLSPGENDNRENESRDNVENREDNPPEGELTTNLLSLSWDDILFRQVLPYLRWKDLFRLRAVCWDTKQMVDAYFKQLKTIDLTVVQCTFTDEAFQLLTSNCTNVRKLIINRSKWIIDRDLSVVFKKNHSLSHLDLSDCGCLNGSCLLPLAVNCKKLRTLILRHCNWLTPGAMETLMTHLDSIEVMDLTCCSGMSNQILLPLVQKFQKLKELRLAYLQTVNDTTLLLISRACNSLLFLDVCGCPNITDRGIKMIGEYCKSIKTLHVAGSSLVTEYSLSLLRDRGVQIDRERAGELVPYIPFYVQV